MTSASWGGNVVLISKVSRLEAVSLDLELQVQAQVKSDVKMVVRKIEVK